MKTEKFKIVIVEDDAFYGEVLRKYVLQVVDRIVPQRQISIIHHVSADACIERLDPDTNIFLLDYNLGDDQDGNSMTGLDLLKIIKRVCPNSDTIIVTNSSDFSTINQFTLQGADRYVLKNTNTPITIITALKQLLDKPSFMS